MTSDVGNYDRVVIQEILKEIAATQQIDLNAKQRFKSASLSSSNVACSDQRAQLSSSTKPTV